MVVELQMSASQTFTGAIANKLNDLFYNGFRFAKL